MTDSIDTSEREAVEPDPFADVRFKTIGQLTDEQKDRAYELWLREQIGHNWPLRDVCESLLRVIDRLRAAPQVAGDERSHVICVCPDCSKPKPEAAQPEPPDDERVFTTAMSLITKHREWVHLNRSVPVGDELHPFLRELVKVLAAPTQPAVAQPNNEFTSKARAALLAVRMSITFTLASNEQRRLIEEALTIDRASRSKT
jgi:hypothetical protein